MDFNALFYAIAIVIMLAVAYVSFWVMVGILVTYMVYSGLAVANEDKDLKP